MRFLVLLFATVCTVGGVTPVHNFHTSLVNGSFIIDDFSRSFTSPCPTTVLEVPSPCVGMIGRVYAEDETVGGAGTGMVIGTSPVYHKFGVTVFAEMGPYLPASGIINTRLSINEGSDDISTFMYTMYDGNFGNVGPLCQIAPPGQGLGGVDLTQGNTQNAFVVTYSTSDVPSYMDITVYNTTGHFHRVRYGINMVFSIPTVYNHMPEAELYIPFGDLNIYNDVDALEIRFYPNLAEAHIGSADIAITSIKTGAASGCSYAEEWDTDATKCDTSLVPECTIVPFAYIITPPVGSPFMYDSAHYRPLPYGNTFNISHQNNLSSNEWRIVNTIATVTGLSRQFGSTYTTGPFAFTPDLGELVIDFRSVSLDSTRLFRNLTLTYTIGSPVYESTGLQWVNGDPLTGPLFTPLGVDMVTPLTTPFSVTVASAQTTNVLTYNYDAGSNLIRGFMLDMSSFSCTPNNPTTFLSGEMITYVLEADGDCAIVEDAVVLAPCVDITGFVFFDTNSNGVYDTLTESPVNSSIPSYTTVFGEEFARPGTMSSNGYFSASCIEVGRTINITVVPPPGYTTSTGPNPLLYEVTSLCNQTILIGLQQENGLCGRVYHDVDGNGTQTISEPGIAGVVVTATNNANPNYMVSGVTDVFGNFLIDPIIIGNYTVDIIGYPMGGFIQTEGMDPTQSSVVFMPNNTKIGPFGYTLFEPRTFTTEEAPVITILVSIASVLLVMYWCCCCWAVAPVKRRRRKEQQERQEFPPTRVRLRWY